MPLDETRVHAVDADDDDSLVGVSAAGEEDEQKEAGDDSHGA